MNFESLHKSELTLIDQLQTALRGPLSDQLMIFLNFFDTDHFYFLALVILWYGYNPACGVRFLFLLMLNSIVNQDLKMLFAEPRPCQLAPHLGILSSKSYGLPSGAAHVWLSGYLLLACTVRRKWFWIVGALCVLVISFSRVYLGLHFPSDIVGGWIIGAIVFTCLWISFPRIEAHLVRLSRTTKSLIALVCFSLLWWLALTPSAAFTMLFGLGASLGLIWSPPLEKPANPLQRFAQSLIALIGFIIIQLLFPPQFGAFVLGFWLVAGVPRFKTRVLLT